MKTRKFILTGMLALAMVAGSLTVGSVAEAAKCSGWTEYKKDAAFCDDSDGCGFLWLKDAKKYKSYQERYCSVNGKQKRETTTTYVKTGCCN